MITRILNPYLDANLVSGSLYQGAYPTLVDELPGTVDAIVLCAKEHQKLAFAPEGVEVVHCPLNDWDFPMTQAEQELAHSTAQFVRWMLDQGAKVLVTCRLGLNRSGVVSALSLMYSPAGTKGITHCCVPVIQAIRAVRTARGPESLGNGHFVKFLYQNQQVCSTRRAG